VVIEHENDVLLLLLLLDTVLWQSNQVVNTFLIEIWEPEEG
jgi:hypothetical protein